MTMQLIEIACNRIVAICVVLVLSGVQAQDEYDDSASVRRAPRLQSDPGFSAGPKPTPVPILKQINRHNEDGSYTYGYESADGTFKIETKLNNGEVKGKYGYVDPDSGKIRVVEYGANSYGFQPAGEGITVAPPTLVDETTNKDGTLNPEYIENDSNYPPPQPQRIAQPQFEFSQPIRKPVNIDYTTPARSFAPAPAQNFAPARSFAPVPAQNFAPAPLHTFAPAPVPQSRPRIQFAEPAPVAEQQDIQYATAAPRFAAPPPQPAYRPQPQPQPAFRPQSQPLQPGRGGVLDQLAKDYALPQNSAAPLHDISFGYY